MRSAPTLAASSAANVGIDCALSGEKRGTDDDARGACIEHLARALDGANAAAGLDRETLGDLRDKRGVVALAHGCIEIDQLDKRKAARTFQSNIQSRRKQGEASRPAPAGRCVRPADRWKESAWKPHGDAGAGQFFFERTRAGHAEVEDAGGKGRIGFAAPEDIDKMIHGSRAAGGDNRNARLLR